jgi:protein ImuB
MEGSRRLIAAVDRVAHDLGLRSGQTITHAQTLVPNLRVVDATPEEDEASLTELALVHRLFAHRRSQPS